MKIAAISGMLGLSLALAACSSAHGSNSATQSGQKHQKLTSITFANPLPSYPGWRAAQVCLLKEAKKNGITATAVGPTGANTDNALTISQIESAIATHQTAIALAAIDPSFQPVIDKARAAGIYVVSLQTLGAAKNVNVDIGTKVEDIGVTVADGIAKQNPTAKIATLSMNAAGVQQQEMTGIQKEIDAKYPGMKIVQSVYDNGNTTSDVDLINNLLTAHPDVNYIFSANGASTGAVVTAVRERGLTGKVGVIVNDLTPESAADIKAGTVYGVNNQSWCGLATQAVDRLIDVSTGKLSASETHSYATPLTFVTKDNLAEAEANPS